LKPGKVILVTGTNSGVGLCLAKRLYHSPYRVVITARKKSIDQIPKNLKEDDNRFLIRPLDVTDDQQRKDLIKEINQKWGGVDVLINNAGVSYRSTIEDMDNESEFLLFKTNFFGPMALTRLVLPKMREKRAGKIINVSSVAGMMAMPTMYAYSSSKFALEGASESLWYEMKPWGIKVSVIQPGFIHSSSFKKVQYTKKSKEGSEKGKPYAVYYQKMKSFVTKYMQKSPSTADQVARTILRTMEKRNPPLRVLATPDATLFYYLRRFLPRAIYHTILYTFLPEIKKWVPKKKTK